MARMLFVVLSFLTIMSMSVHGENIAHRSYIAVISLNIPVNPIAVRFLDTSLTAAGSGGAALAVIVVDSTGGDAASISSAVSLISKAGLPVVVVRGKAADTNAGTEPTAFDYLARAAARPVALGSAASKARAGAAGLDAAAAGVTVNETIRNLDGVTLDVGGRPVVLHTAGLPIRPFTLSPPAKLVSELLNPNIAYALLILGILGIILELSVPGGMAPGLLGGISLIVSLIAFGMMSANFGGLLIILLGFVLFILDIKAPTHGILTGGGIIALIAGSFMLFPSWQSSVLPGVAAFKLSVAAILIAAATLAGMFAGVLTLGVRAQALRVTVGGSTLIGLTGVALTDLTPGGVVRVATEEWSATCVGDDLRAGTEVDVVGVEGIRLVVMERL